MELLSKSICLKIELVPDNKSASWAVCFEKLWKPLLKIDGWSRELLSTTRTSHSSDSGSVEAATLLRAFSKVRQRLYVHKMTVMFTGSVTAPYPHCRDEPGQMTVVRER